MMLKGSRVDVSPQRTSAYLDAVEAVQQGKRNADKRLYKYVEDGMITSEHYNILVMKYRITKRKKQKERAKKIKSALCIILSIAVMLSSTESAMDYLLETYSEESAVWYFFLYLWAIFYAFTFNPSSGEIAKLERENELLKEKIKSLEVHQE